MVYLENDPLRPRYETNLSFFERVVQAAGHYTQNDFPVPSELKWISGTDEPHSRTSTSDLFGPFAFGTMGRKTLKTSSTVNILHFI